MRGAAACQNFIAKDPGIEIFVPKSQSVATSRKSSTIYIHPPYIF